MVPVLKDSHDQGPGEHDNSKIQEGTNINKEEPYKCTFESEVLKGVREGHMISYLNKQFELHIFIKMVREQNITEEMFPDDEAKNLFDKCSGKDSAMEALADRFK